jgi:hypothetical protein
MNSPDDFTNLIRYADDQWGPGVLVGDCLRRWLDPGHYTSSEIRYAIEATARQRHRISGGNLGFMKYASAILRREREKRETRKAQRA